LSQTDEYKNYKKALAKYAEVLNNAAKRTLGTRRIGKNKSYGNASGKLRKSLTYQFSGNSVMFGSPQPSSKFIYWGVNGTSKKRGSPFSYGSKQPPSKAILEWMRVKPIRLRNESGQFIQQTPSLLNSAAFLIARAIKKKGIAGLRYYEKAFEYTFPRAEKELGESFAKDLFSNFSAKIGNIKLTPQ
jgi:hypothetical protein